MAKSNTWEQGLMLLLFNNDSFAGVGDAGGLLQSVADGSLYISLHTASPGETGDQTTNETAYTGYGRQGKARTAAEWDVHADGGSGTYEAYNVNEVLFGECTASPGSAITHVGLGTASSGAGKLLYVATLGTAVTMSIGTQPRFVANALKWREG